MINLTCNDQAGHASNQSDQLLPCQAGFSSHLYRYFDCLPCDIVHFKSPSLITNSHLLEIFSEICVTTRILEMIPDAVLFLL